MDPPDNKKIKARLPRKPREGPYQLTNAYSQSPAPQQILTLVVFILQLACHSVFVVPGVVRVDHPILWVLLGFHYLALLIVARDYIYLTTKDPVDKLVQNEELSAQLHPS